MISKKFFLASIIVASGLIFILDFIGWAGSWGRDGWQVWSSYQIVRLIPSLYIGIVWLVLIYKLWSLIQDGFASTSPGRAVGFMFIPLFNLYWLFRAVWGFARDFNSYVRRYSLSVPLLSEGLFLAWCIFSLASGILLGAVQGIEKTASYRPLVTGGLSVISSGVFLILGVFVTADACDGANGIVRERPASSPVPAAAGGQVRCPRCEADLPGDSRFCDMCGQAIGEKAAPDPSPPAACRRCGNGMSAGARFCSMCGQPGEEG